LTIVFASAVIMKVKTPQTGGVTRQRVIKIKISKIIKMWGGMMWIVRRGGGEAWDKAVERAEEARDAVRVRRALEAVEAVGEVMTGALRAAEVLEAVGEESLRALRAAEAVRMAAVALRAVGALEEAMRVAVEVDVMKWR
jgi:hypothetical protein